MDFETFEDEGDAVLGFVVDQFCHFCSCGVYCILLFSCMGGWMDDWRSAGEGCTSSSLHQSSCTLYTTNHSSTTNTTTIPVD